MSIIKYIERVQRMDDLIRRKATGTPEEFADRLGLNRSMLLENLNELRDLGAEIKYSRFQNSYYYEKEFTLIISGRVKVFGGDSIQGGFYSPGMTDYWTGNPSNFSSPELLDW